MGCATPSGPVASGPTCSSYDYNFRTPATELGTKVIQGIYDGPANSQNVESSASLAVASTDLHLLRRRSKETKPPHGDEYAEQCQHSRECRRFLAPEVGRDRSCH